MTKMQDNLKNTPGGFIVQLEAPLITPEDFEMMQEVMQWAFLQDMDLDSILEHTFELPYDQGPGYVRLWKDVYEFEFFDDPERAQSEAALHTGWWVEFGYSDSFGGPQVSPIFVSDPVRGHFKFWIRDY
jgi:hypothetical protein